MITEDTHFIVQVRPALGSEPPPWWPRGTQGEAEFVTIDPEDPPGWSLGADAAHAVEIEALEEEGFDDVEEFKEALSAVWAEEMAPDSEDDDQEEEDEDEELIPDCDVEPEDDEDEEDDMVLEADPALMALWDFRVRFVTYEKH